MITHLLFIDGADITDMKALYSNPLDSNQPSAYLATNRGLIHLYIPTTKLEHSARVCYYSYTD